ncbi:MAG TPA: hypothetical protein VMU81_08665 [Acetobacteraceae bacterium]|nr:hypothetical protein [Acetobacteraceae bacterium]
MPAFDGSLLSIKIDGGIMFPSIAATSVCPARAWPVLKPALYLLQCLHAAELLRETRCAKKHTTSPQDRIAKTRGIVTVTRFGRVLVDGRDWRHEAATGSILPPSVPR